MKAIVQREYGSPDVLVLSEIDRPEPRDDEVLVAVRAASVGPWVWRMVGPDPQLMRIAGGGLFKPKRSTPGADMSGVVEAIGSSVEGFRPGDEVYGEAEGTFAEYTCASERHLAPKSINLSFEQAAAVPVAGNTALLGLRDHGHLQAGHRVLIIGASGGVGSFAVQVAKALAADVTGVCSTGSVETVWKLGADHVIDYTEHDFTIDDDQYDVIFQLAGRQPASALRSSLTRNGTLVLSSGEGGPWIGPIGRIMTAVVTSPFVSQTYRPFYAAPNGENLVTLTELVESGMVTPLIDRTYSLSDAAAAIDSAQHDHVRGKIVVTV